jgi:hypothetical protein
MPLAIARIPRSTYELQKVSSDFSHVKSNERLFIFFLDVLSHSHIFYQPFYGRDRFQGLSAAGDRHLRVKLGEIVIFSLK